MMAIGPMEIGLLVFLILLFFGAKRLPRLARQLRLSVLELRKGGDDETSPVPANDGPRSISAEVAVPTITPVAEATDAAGEEKSAGGGER